MTVHDVPRTWRRAALTALFSCLLLAPPALAAPVAVGAGSDAAVTVDAAGTSYIAYNGLPSSNQPLRLCKLPRGASACASTTDLPVAGPGTISSDARPFVSVSGMTVRVLSYRYGFSSGDFARDVLFTSADGGATFGAGVQVGNLHPNGDAVAGPGAGISLVNSASASHSYQRVPTDGSTQATTSAALSSQYLNGGSVALVDPAKPLVVFDDGTNAAFSIFNGGPINDAASWSAPAVIGAATYERLAGGPSGVFAMLATGGHLEVRKFGGTAFGSQTTIPSSDSNSLSASDLVQDAAGRLQALWPDASGNLFQSTSDDGVTWATQKLTTFADVRTMRGAATSDHGGVATWTAGTGGSAKVWATALLPPPQPPPDPGPPRDHPPVASFTITPALPCTHQPVTFNASASVSYVGSGKLTYNWEIGAVENQFRNPEDRFIGSTGSNPLLTRSFGPFRPVAGPGGFPYNPGPGDFLYGGDVLFGKHHRVPLIVLLTVVDEDGVASERIDQTLNFGDAEYNPYHEQGQPTPPKPHCPRLGVPLPVAIGRSGLVANGPKTSVALGCPKANDCVGRVTLSTALASRRPRVRVAAGKKPRTLKLASTRFVIQAGKKRKLALSISKAGRRLLAKKGKLHVTIQVATTNQVGKTKVSRRTTTLRSRGRH